MKTGLLRPSAALFPLAGLTAALLGREESVISLFFLVHCIQLFSLCAADCFRNGAAREPGVRRVDRRFGGALVQLAGGILLLALAARFLFPREIRACSLIAAACICIEQLFEERMFALSRSLDGAILSLISNLLLLVGLMLEGGALEAPLPGFFLACAAGLSALIAAVTAYALERAHGFSLKPRNLPLCPRAVLQTLLYPALGAAALLLHRRMGAPQAQPLPLLSGLILWRLARTVARRAADESRPLNLLLLLPTAGLAAASAFLPALLPWAAALLLSLLCAALVFCAPSVRLFCGIFLCGGALALASLHPLPPTPCAAAACALSAAAVALNLRRAFLKRV